MTVRNAIVFFTAVLGSAATLWAPPRRLTDFGLRSSVDAADARTPEAMEMPMASRLQNQSFELKEWHGQFSDLGQRRARLSTSRRFDTEVVEMPDYGMQRARIRTTETWTGNRERAQDWNVVREQVMASRFDPQRAKAPGVRQYESMVDQVSLRDINRFQSVRNQTDDGIPVQDVGSANGSMMTRETVSRRPLGDSGEVVTTRTFPEGGDTPSTNADADADRADSTLWITPDDGADIDRPAPPAYIRDPRREASPSRPTASSDSQSRSITVEETTRTRTRDDGAVERTRIKVRVKE